MNKIKKILPAFLYATLLLTIAILSIAITHSSGKANPDNLLPTVDKNEIENTSSETNNSNSTDTALPLPGNEQDIPQHTLYEDCIPRKSIPDNKFSYKQKIYGNGETKVSDVIQTSVGLFTIVNTTSTQGDICGKNPCIGIIKTDSYGNILKALSLNYTFANTYITSCPTSEGLVIITTTKEINSYSYVFILSYELEEISQYKIGYSEKGRIVPTSGSFLYFAEFNDELLLYSYNDGKFIFQSIGFGHIIDIFEYGDYYTTIISKQQENSYSALKIAKKDLCIISETTCIGAVALNVFPINIDGKQEFIVLENCNSTIFAKIYDNQSFTTFNLTKRIGSFELRNAFIDSDKILMVCAGNINGIISLSFSLEARFCELSSNFITTDIREAVYNCDTLYCIANDENNNTFLVASRENIIYTLYLDISSDLIKLVLNLDGTLTIIYQSDSDVIIVGVKKLQ